MKKLNLMSEKEKLIKEGNGILQKVSAYNNNARIGDHILLKGENGFQIIPSSMYEVLDIEFGDE